MLVFVYAASAVVTLRPIFDSDVWWHLRTGQWIVQHRAVPVTDPFSTYGAGSPWVAYSWLFEVGMYGLHAALGHIGLILYVVVGGMAVTSALLVLVMRFESRIPRATALTAVGIAAIATILMPRPYLVSMCLFIVELHVLFAARETGRTRYLWLLPPLFVLWANVHIEFVYGLLVLCLAAAESLVVRLAPRIRIAPRSVPLRAVLLTTAASVVATLVSPYGVEIYRPVIEFGSQGLAYHPVIEPGAPAFRRPEDWLFLAVVVAGVYSLGRQRPLPLLPTLLVAVGAYLSFSTRRDMWVLVVTAVTILATTWGDRRGPRPVLPWKPALAAVFGILLTVAAVALARNVSPASVGAAVARTYPAAASAIVRERGYPGPLYSTVDWGGFLMWRVPELAVALDGRSDVHGQERMWRSFYTASGNTGWDTDEDLGAARLVILPVDIPLTQLLRRDRHYDIVYEDEVAVVFTRREPDVTPEYRAEKSR